MKETHRPLTPFLRQLIPLTLMILSWGAPPLSQAQEAQAQEAQAQEASFQPTVLESEEAAQKTFDGLERGFKGFKPLLLQFGTQCTQRAQAWSFELDRVHRIQTQKIFVFYTHAYQEFYQQKHGHRFKWWFHVAPFVLVKSKSGQIEERAIDASFSDRPLPIHEWTNLFVESGKPCVEQVRFADFEGDVTSEGRSHDATAHCYVIRAPMVDMFPLDVDAREKSQRHGFEWDLGQVFHSAQAMTSGAKKRYLRRVGLR